jgi:hypothetical protein
MGNIVSKCIFYPESSADDAVDAMINAFLVFNGQGQPRLTKFYTQLASLSHLFLSSVSEFAG